MAELLSSFDGEAETKEEKKEKREKKAADDEGVKQKVKERQKYKCGPCEDEGPDPVTGEPERRKCTAGNVGFGYLCLWCCILVNRFFPAMANQGSKGCEEFIEWAKANGEDLAHWLAEIVAWKKQNGVNARLTAAAFLKLTQPPVRVEGVRASKNVKRKNPHDWVPLQAWLDAHPGREVPTKTTSPIDGAKLVYDGLKAGVATPLRRDGGVTLEKLDEEGGKERNTHAESG